MAETRRRLILTGARAGMTCALRKLSFVDGTCVIDGPEVEVENVCKYMGRVYKAFSEGSVDLKHYQKLDRERKAARASEANTSAGPTHSVATVQDSTEPLGTGPTPETNDNGQGAAAPATGPTEQHTNGDGACGVGGNAGQPTEQSLQQIIKNLDPDDEELWTHGGQPRCDAVAAACGREDITRKVIETAAPGFVRPVQ